MTAALAAPVTQVCAFVLGCALIHAARAHADRITRLLAVTAVGAAVLVLLVASFEYAPEGGTFDEVTVYAAA